jgi:hypothetical protein
VEFDGAFSVTIKPAAAAAAMRKAVESPNQAIGLQIAGVDDCIHMLSLYPADEPKGLVTFKWVADRLTVTLKGSWPFVDSDMIAEPWFAAAAEKGIPVEAGICDPDYMPLAVGPDDATSVVVGVLRPIGAAATSAPKSEKSVAGVSIKERIKEQDFTGRVAEALELVYCADADLDGLLERLSGKGAREAAGFDG